MNVIVTWYAASHFGQSAIGTKMQVGLRNCRFIVGATPQCRYMVHDVRTTAWDHRITWRTNFVRVPCIHHSIQLRLKHIQDASKQILFVAVMPSARPTVVKLVPVVEKYLS